MPGRPTKLNRRLVQNVTQLIALGCSYKTTCDAVGITYTTWKRWIIEGRNPENKRQRAFRAALKRAKAENEIRCLTNIRDAAERPQHWTAAAWLLERVINPQRYGRQPIQVNANNANFTWAEVAKTISEDDIRGEIAPSVEESDTNGWHRG